MLFMPVFAAGPSARCVPSGGPRLAPARSTAHAHVVLSPGLCPDHTILSAEITSNWELCRLKDFHRSGNHLLNRYNELMIIMF